METRSIETFFLNSFLRICMVGVSLILVSDLILYPQDTLTLLIDASILSACIVAYLIRRRFPNLSVFLITSVVLLSMLYQSLAVPANTTTSLSIILIVGFIYSVMLKGKMMWLMHITTFILLHTIFFIQFRNPELRFSSKLGDVVTVAITYSILYFILNYATAMLKSSYDKINGYLNDSNIQLQEKANEIETQNEELRQASDNLNSLNKDLERIVNERTAKIQLQNEILMKYSYANAHHLRGPVARILGLITVRELEHGNDNDFFFIKIKEQAEEIDSVVKQINVDLIANDRNA
jgi:hypothetical protein